jgi:hypothetical protein
MNGNHGGSCCSHDDTTATQDDPQRDQATEMPSAGTPSECCRANTGQTSGSQPNRA